MYLFYQLLFPLNLLSAIFIANLNDWIVGSKLAIFFPVISNAVPCAGVVIGISKPPETGTPLSNQMLLNHTEVHHDTFPQYNHDFYF